MSVAAVEARGVHFGYGSSPVLNGLDLRVDAGQFVVLTGPNGSGKSTLIKLMVGLLSPDSGEVLVLGKPAADRAARRQVGYAPQISAGQMVLPVSVAELVEAGVTSSLPLLSRPGPEQRQQIATALEAVGLGDLASECVFELSGGQQQRALIARALVGDKPVLVLDEPTTGIDRQFRPRLVRDLRTRADSGAAVLVVSHDPDDFHDVCDRILFTEDGQLRDVSHEDFHAEEGVR
ncbi:MAG: metal ABC transporter ATP-binding protein [Actinomycetota bacterium]